MTYFTTVVLIAAFGLAPGFSLDPVDGQCPANSVPVKCAPLEECPGQPSHKENSKGKCVPIKPTKCWRAGGTLYFEPRIKEDGLAIQLRSTEDYSNKIEMVKKTKAGKGYVNLTNFCSKSMDCWEDRDELMEYEQIFFHDVDAPFEMRFVDEDGVQGRWFECYKNTPIAFDLDGSGHVEKIDGEWQVDMDADGELEVINEWFAPTEGILLDGRAPLGELVTGEYLFGDTGNAYENGYEKLSIHHDVNEDHMVSGPELMGLKIWVDANSNAIVDAGEVHELSTFGIVAISVDAENLISHAVLVDGTKMMTEDLIFTR